MTNNTRYYFKDLEPMFGKKPTFILVNSKLQMQDLGGRQVITMSVDMEGYDENNKLMFRLPGCPYPPCKPVQNVDFEGAALRSK